MRQHSVGAAERGSLRRAELAALRRVLGHAGHEIGDPEAAFAIDPQARAEAVSVARVPDEDGAARSHVVRAAGRRNLLRRQTVGTDVRVLAVAGAVVAVVAPHLSEKRLHRLGRNDANAVERSVIEEHAPDPRQPAHRNAQAALRAERGTVLTRMPEREIARRTVL